MSKNNLRLLSMMLPLLTGDSNIFPVQKEKEKEKRKCLYCGKMHNHNNSFCSPECCKNYKKED